MKSFLKNPYAAEKPFHYIDSQFQVYSINLTDNINQGNNIIS